MVCIYTEKHEVFLANPSTREVKELNQSKNPQNKSFSCWSFGYDASVDDYKVLLGYEKGKDRTCFEIKCLELYSEVKYMCIGSKSGIFM